MFIDKFSNLKIVSFNNIIKISHATFVVYDIIFSHFLEI